MLLDLWSCLAQVLGWPAALQILHQRGGGGGEELQHGLLLKAGSYEVASPLRDCVV